MKKLKNILSLSIVALCAFCLLGITDVFAANGTASGFTVACEDTSLEKGSTTTCYLLAKIRNSGGNGIDGVVAYVKNTTKNLELGAPTEATKKTGEMQAESLTSSQKPKNAGSANAKDFECKQDRCDIFYAKSGQTITEVTEWSANGVDKISGHTGYTVVGSYGVQLSEDATMTDCGRLCLDVKWSQNGGYTAADLGSAGDVPCAEIKPSGTPEGTPDTGSFTSYIVLIGGAFLAFGAIALARKNNKFYRV